ncbi:hypothetical protein [Paracoccus sp. (in: a-proteobacteria)]|uniref:hypothetical protein n=1 Tax=Paracoccus sp. TaxID=267 RepID=UPI00396C882C
MAAITASRLLAAIGLRLARKGDLIVNHLWPNPLTSTAPPLTAFSYGILMQLRFVKWQTLHIKSRSSLMSGMRALAGSHGPTAFYENLLPHRGFMAETSAKASMAKTIG